MTMKRLEVDGQFNRINRQLILLGIDKTSKRTNGIAQVSPRLYQKTWLKNPPASLFIIDIIVIYNHMYLHKLQTGHVQWVELEEGRSYKLITRAMKPLLFGE